MVGAHGRRGLSTGAKWMWLLAILVLAAVAGLLLAIPSAQRPSLVRPTPGTPLGTSLSTTASTAS